MKKFFFLKIFIFSLMLAYSSPLDDIIDKTIRFNNWAEAKQQLNAYLDQKPSDIKALILLAEVENNLNEYDNAILTIRKAINYSKNNKQKGELYFNLGNYYFNKGLYDQAMENYKKAMAYHPQLAQAQYMAGVISIKEKKMDEGIEYWKEYVKKTDNVEKKIKIEDIISRYEQQKIESKLKAEEEQRMRDEFLKQLKEELEKEEADSKSLEADKNKTKESEEDFEELDF